ncbi:MAG: metallophosphoesterase [Planctomycetaceae bacterium]|jgi:predicted MPP superfamily phosphohydrolase|nr:metallophosphoesterase [Planctomycetaceae bacterium]
MMFFWFYNISMFMVVIVLLLRVWRNCGISIFQFIFLCAIGCFSAVFLGLGHFNYASHGLAWYGSGFLIGSGVIFLTHHRNTTLHQIWKPISLFVTAFLILSFSVIALFVEPTRLEILRYEYRTNLVTKPVRVAFIADIQSDQFTDYERRTLMLLKEQNADLIILGGDYVQAPTMEIEYRLIREFNALLKEVKLEAPLGVYAIKGNQEDSRWYDWALSFEGTNINVINHTRRLNLGEIRVVLLSMEHSFSKRRFAIYNPGASRRLPQSKKQFILMAGHSPRFALAEQKVHLALAGHTHGGQIQIPFWGALFNLTAGLPTRWSSGDHRLPNGSILIVSKGTGMERGRAPRVRFNCKPDFLVIDIVPESSNK